MTTLVTGASGTVGRSLVAQLARAGEPVRAMTRNPAVARFPAGVEVVHGDLGDPATLPAAMEGADRLHLFPFPETATEVMALASKAGVRRVTVLSSGSVTAGFDTDYQFLVEQAVEASGLEWTHLRPGEFAAIGAAIGEEVRLVEVGRDEALRQLREQGGWAAVNGPFILGYEGFSPGTEYPELASEELEPLSTVEQVTGRPARSFAAWARDHAQDFR
jgi:NAD(P)-dependent dehydrogenase (short-subunit alcohol dehydrogenase family)